MSTSALRVTRRARIGVESVVWSGRTARFDTRPLTAALNKAANIAPSDDSGAFKVRVTSGWVWSSQGTTSRSSTLSIASSGTDNQSTHRIPGANISSVEGSSGNLIT